MLNLGRRAKGRVPICANGEDGVGATAVQVVYSARTAPI